VLGLLVPLAIQCVITLLILWIQRRATWDYVSLISLGSFLVTSGLGFWLVTGTLTPAVKLGVAVGYFPVMFVLMFFEALYLDARLYGNNF
jgi:hypothetical protein